MKIGGLRSFTLNSNSESLGSSPAPFLVIAFLKISGPGGDSQHGPGAQKGKAVLASARHSP